MLPDKYFWAFWPLRLYLRHLMPFRSLMALFKAFKVIFKVFKALFKAFIALFEALFKG